MQIECHINTNRSDRAALARYLETKTARALRHLSERLTHLTIHVEAAPAPHKRMCTLEARPARGGAIGVSSSAQSTHDALTRALTKLRKALQTQLGPRHAHKGAVTIRKDGNRRLAAI